MNDREILEILCRAEREAAALILEAHDVLTENMAKWGHPNVVVTQAYPRDFARFIGSFDLILADVPCSGEGMMRKEEVAVTQWSPQLIEQCAALQRSIIADVWPALRPGGILIYSTCTFNPIENEGVIEGFLREHPEFSTVSFSLPGLPECVSL